MLIPAPATFERSFTSVTPLTGWTNRSLTQEDWDRVAPLLPPPYAGVGRPPLDHQLLLAGMLWIMGRGASWRELPQPFGKWNTVYCRYRKWRREGLWQRLLAVLAADHSEGSIIPGGDWHHSVG